jgi:hypothetical protein
MKKLIVAAIMAVVLNQARTYDFGLAVHFQ